MSTSVKLAPLAVGLSRRGAYGSIRGSTELVTVKSDIRILTTLKELLSLEFDDHVSQSAKSWRPLPLNLPDFHTQMGAKPWVS